MEQTPAHPFAVGYGNGYGYPTSPTPPPGAPIAGAVPLHRGDAATVAWTPTGGLGPSAATDPTVRVDITAEQLIPNPAGAPEGTVPSGPPVRRGSRLLVAGIAALALLVLGAVGAWAWVGQGHNDQNANLASASGHRTTGPTGSGSGNLGSVVATTPGGEPITLDGQPPTGDAEPGAGTTLPADTTTTAPSGPTTTSPADDPHGSGGSDANGGAGPANGTGTGTGTGTGDNNGGTDPDAPTPTTPAPTTPPVTDPPPTTPSSTPPATLGDPPVSIKIGPSTPVLLFPQITSFAVTSSPSCIPPFIIPSWVNTSWTTKGASSVTLSIDGPGIYNTFGATGATSVPFSCPGAHTYTLTAHGSNGLTASKSITVIG